MKYFFEIGEMACGPKQFEYSEGTEHNKYLYSRQLGHEIDEKSRERKNGHQPVKDVPSIAPIVAHAIMTLFCYHLHDEKNGT